MNLTNLSALSMSTPLFLYVKRFLFITIEFKFTMHYLKTLYNFFTFLALIIFFFSTTKVEVKAFQINDIEVSKPFEKNFNKNKVIDIGFEKAFFELINSLIKSNDIKKIDKIKLNEIKSMIESFSIKEEKFIKEIYYLNLGVTFDKKKIFNYLEKKNIFPAQIIKETFLFIPIIIDENNDDLIIFSKNQIYKKWNTQKENSHLINYLLATEDLEDLNFIKSKSNVIENYDFKEIINKYFLNHSIISLIFKNKNETKVLSKIQIQDKIIIKNNSFKITNFDDEIEVQSLINKLKIIYEDQWKEFNQINTSIKLPLFIRVNNNDLEKSLKFEKTLENIDLINKFFINRFDKDYIFYEIIFNGTPKNFINILSEKKYEIDTQKKIWILK